MSDGTDEWPRDARVPDESRTKFDELTESGDSPFHGWESNELFVFAATFGYDQGLRTEMDASDHALFQWSQLDDAQMWVVKSLAVKETESPDVLNKGGKISTIAREYAKGGIDRLYERYVGTEDLFTSLTDDAIDLADI